MTDIERRLHDSEARQRPIGDPGAPAFQRLQQDAPGDLIVPVADEAPSAEPATAVSGRVGTWAEAAAIRHGMVEAGIAEDDIEVFYTGPAGRHAITPFGGDSLADAGSMHRGTGAIAGGAAGAAIGLAVGAALATATFTMPVLLTAAAVGAYGGALAGGVGATDETKPADDEPEHPVGKPAGIVIAARVDHRKADDAIALRCLNDGNAIALERGPALWFDGRWVDWDPVARREQLAPAPGTPQA
jgi:hypothetical protein